MWTFVADSWRIIPFQGNEEPEEPLRLRGKEDPTTTFAFCFVGRPSLHAPETMACCCALCGAEDSYLDEVIVDDQGGRMFVCSDTDYCAGRQEDAA